MTIVVERTAIPVDGPEAHLGAAAFMAVLAYPMRGERQKRIAFIEAWKGALSKHYLSRLPWRSPDRGKILNKYRNMPNQQINNTINRGVYRIAARRFVAARLASEKIMYSHFADATGVMTSGASLLGFAVTSAIQKNMIAVAGGFVEQAAKVRLTRITKPPNSIRSAVSREAERKKKWGAAGSGAASIMSREWSETRPVLHLALALGEVCLDRGGFDPLDLVHRPEWLHSALRNAEMMRVTLAQHFEISPPEVVVLVAEGCP